LVEQISERYLLISLDRESALEEDPDSHARIISWRWVDNS
ncbi:MAG: tRNA (adenosine(37)-N6)-threonylcarbamoyltransferase complex ATPase subunit type 1 TsaE, partial [Corynebacterium casei]|nr:tRNA (adenosine(37)-N6)-threonylcarbamoyltransferase complex ATPase subunit type 1 TsaE [Corynebacterium casei]